MATYVKRSCPKCRRVLQGWTQNFLAFGVPYEVCSTCHTVIDRRHYFNEWFLTDRFRKAEYVFAFMITGAMIGGAAGATVAFALAGLSILPFDEYKAFLFSFVALSAAGFVIRYAIRFRKEVDLSIGRSKDEAYMRTLKALGLLEKGVERTNLLVKVGFVAVVSAVLIYSFSR